MKKVLAFDIGGTNTRLALVNEKFQIEKKVVIDTIRTTNPNKFLENITQAIDKIDVDINSISSFGAGIPGVCNKETGYIYDLPNVYVKDIPLGEFIKNKYQKNIYVRNDAEVACLAEACIGAGKSYSRVFFITISTGLGGAMCIDGINQDYITEIGHTAYTYKGKLTEYEKICSGDALTRQANEAKLNIKHAGEFFELVKSGNTTAIYIYKDWLINLTSFINMIQNSYQPEIITFTGGVMKSKDIFFEDLKKMNPNSNMVEADLNQDAGLYGAGIYAFKH